MHTRLCDQFGIEFPIFAFSHCRDVVAAVTRAGGMGVLGALAFSPDELEIELRWIDEHCDGKPYGVDVVMPVKYEGADETQLQAMIPAGHRAFIEDVLGRYRVPQLPDDMPAPKGLLGWSEENARPQVDVALGHKIVLLASALGPPPADVIGQAHGQGVQVAALVGSAKQAVDQLSSGTDIIVAQGGEAGGHTGDVATMVLVPEVVAAVGGRPVLAAGGIGSGRQAAAAMALGADGVWTGSIWLTVQEADTGEVLTEKLLAAGSRDTVRSRSMTGKPARQLRTAWTEAWDSPESPGTLPMPLQYMLTADAQQRIRRAATNPETGGKELITTPVGQIVGTMNQVRPTREVIYRMVEEYLEAVEGLRATLSD